MPRSHPAQELEVAIEKMNTFNAWEIDAEAKRVLEAVGITDLNAKVDQVSATGCCTANRHAVWPGMVDRRAVWRSDLLWSKKGENAGRSGGSGEPEVCAAREGAV